LVEHVDVIVHNSAWVNVLLNYETLRASNVLSTIEALRLASHIGQDRAVQFGFVSTMSVVMSSYASSDREDFPLSNCIQLALPNLKGYALSKFVAEYMVHQAWERGLVSAQVFRPGTIGGNTHTLTLNHTDFATRTLKGIVACRAFPKISRTAVANWIPVDYCASLIVGCMMSVDHENEKQCKVYHLLNPRGNHCWIDVFETLQLLFKQEKKINIQAVSMSEWLTIIERAPDTNPLKPLISKFRSRSFPSSRTHYNMENTLQWIKKSGTSQCPLIDQTFLLPLLDELS